MITSVSKLREEVGLVFGGKRGVEVWCVRMNSRYCIVFCQRELPFHQVRGDSSGWDLMVFEV